MTYALAMLGLALLFGGGELLVRGAVALARRFGISPLLIGMTVVGFCTSAPELIVSLQAGLRGQPGLAVGNVVGSNVANVLLILGMGALVRPIVIDPRELYRDTGVMAAGCVLLAALALSGAITRWQGALMVLTLVTFIAYSYRAERRRPSPPGVLHEHEAAEIGTSPGVGHGLGYLLAGVVSLVVGSRLLIDNATAIATSIGVSEAVIGLTLVALGTSLPELATSVVAAFRGHADVAVGNVVGSNTFNILGILGATAVVTPIPIDARFAAVDVWVMIAAVAALLPMLFARVRMGRAYGATLVALYIAYTVFLYTA
ncbi:MAG: calcium/sodium antiporter [Coriobacteriia bacterium]